MYGLRACRRQFFQKQIFVHPGFLGQTAGCLGINRVAGLFFHRVGAGHGDLIGKQVCNRDDALGVTFAHQNDITPALGKRYMAGHESCFYKTIQNIARPDEHIRLTADSQVAHHQAGAL